MSLTLSEILKSVEGQWVNAELFPGKEPETIQVTRLAELSDVGEGRLVFFFSREYQDDALKAQPPSVLVTAPPFLGPIQKLRPDLWQKSVVVSSEQPYVGFARMTQVWAGKTQVEPRVHASANVAASAKLGTGVSIAEGVTVGSDANIGEDVVLHAGVRIGRGVHVGAQTELFENVVLYPGVQVGARVRIHANSVIGADGFGYALEVQNGRPVQHVKIEHLGTVQIEDDVEIGALTSIDRGTLGATVIGAGAKIDNHVQIGHNVQVGPGAVICGSAGLAGSSKIGPFAVLGGMVGVSNRVHVGAGAQIGGMSFVSKNIPEGETYLGNPIRPAKEFFRFYATLNRWFKKGRVEREN